MKKVILIKIITLITYKSFSFQVSPIEINFEPKGINSVQTVHLKNTEEYEIPIEIKIYKRKHANGKEIRIPTKDFSFFPNNLILNPKEERNIRISWMGERDSINPKKMAKNEFLVEGNRRLKSEKAYRLEVRQVPVNIKRKKKKTGIDFIYNYVASLYVTPLSSKAKIVVQSTKRISQNEMIAQIQNQGTSHAILAEYEVTASSLKNSVSTKLERQSEEVRGVNLLPNEVRTVKLKIPKNAPSNDLELKFKRL